MSQGEEGRLAHEQAGSWRVNKFNWYKVPAAVCSTHLHLGLVQSQLRLDSILQL